MSASGTCRTVIRRSLITLLAGIGLILANLQAQAAPPDEPYPGVLPHDSSDVACPLEFDTGSPLTLAKAVDLALCNNADIRVAWANIRVQAAALGEARAADWPTLSVSVSELNDRTGYPGAPIPATETTANAIYGSLDWRIFDFGGRAATRRAAASLLKAAVASQDATIQKTLSAVVQAYFGALTAKAAADDQAQDESIARETLTSAQRRETQGEGAQSDTLQATTALERISLEQSRAQGAYDKAVAVLVYSLGVPTGSAVQLDDAVDLRTGTEQKDLTTWLAEAQQRHPAILAAQAALQAAQDQVTSARSAGRPTVDFSANYYQNGFPNQGLTSTSTRAAVFGVTVSVPLFDGFLSHYRVQEAQAEAKVKQAELQDTEQATLMGVVQAYADAQSSLRDLSVSEDLLKAAEAAFRSSQRRYNQGAAGIVELLSTQAALADAQDERTACVAEWRSARLSLLASAGELNRAALH